MPVLKQDVKQTKRALRKAKLVWDAVVKLSPCKRYFLLFDEKMKRWFPASILDLEADIEARKKARKEKEGSQ
jgi:hypothetical protein